MYATGQSANHHSRGAICCGRIRFRLFRQLRLPCGRRCDSLLSQRQRRRHRQPVPGAGAPQYDGAAAARIYLHAHRPHGGFQGGLLLVFAGSLFRGGLPDGPFVFPRPARASDLPSAPADRRGGFDLAPDGGLHLPRPRQRVPQYDHQEPFAESAAGELRQDAAFRSPAAPRAGDDYAAVGAVPPFRRSRARALRPGARSVVLRRQTLHFDPLPVDHRAQRGAQFGQGVHRPFGDAGDQDDAPVDRPFGAGDRLPAPVSRPVLPRAFFQEARGGIAHRVPQQQKIGIRVSDFCPLRAVNSASGTVCVPA